MKLNTRSLRLDFDKDSPFEGAKVVLRLSVSFGQFMYIEQTMAENELTSAKCISLLLDLITEWNLENEEGEPIPVTAEGFEKIEDVGFFAILLVQWRRTVISQVVPDAPLGKR